MLTKKQVKEIHEHLERAQNPIFFFDNDCDGLCSFLLLQHWLGRGKGVSIKGSASLEKEYFRKISELNADYVFILDKPKVSQEFFDKVNQINLPIVWIDHHALAQEIPDFVNYYNPLVKKKTKKINFLKEESIAEPVTALCYQVTQKKDDLWLAVAGCLSDKFVPKFYSRFFKKYPELCIKSKSAFEILYNSEIGKLALILNFALMDRTTNVVNMLWYLNSAKGPYDVLNENKKNKAMHLRFNQIDKKCKKLMEKAKIIGENCGKILFFQYGGDFSMSAEIANRLSYLFPEKIICVAKIKESKINISVRGENIKEAVEKSVQLLEDATGGGHPNAAGAQINIKDWEKFKETFEQLVIEKNYRKL